MKLRPKVARMQSTSSWPWLLARRTSGRIRIAIDRPVQREGRGHDADASPDSGLNCVRGEEPERAEGAGDQHFAVGEVHDAGDAVLQLQPHRHQRVGAAEQQAR